jgi:hypothetical protein
MDCLTHLYSSPDYKVEKTIYGPELSTDGKKLEDTLSATI